MVWVLALLDLLLPVDLLSGGILSESEVHKFVWEMISLLCTTLLQQ